MNRADESHQPGREKPHCDPSAACGDAHADATLEVVLDPYAADFWRASGAAMAAAGGATGGSEGAGGRGAAAAPDLAALEIANQRFQLLARLGCEICSQTVVSQVLASVAEALRTLIEAERFFVAIFDERNELRVRAAWNIDLPANPAEWPISRTLLGRVLDEGVAILSSDAAHDPRFREIPSVGLHKIRSIVCVPVGQRGRCMGAIYADSRIQANRFSEADLAFVTALSHYVRIGLRNASQMEEISTQRRLSEERCAALQQELFRDHHIVGRSECLLAAFNRLKNVAAKTLPILISGETGAGKELFARAAHQLSPRAKGPFVALNLANLPETLIESELFGQVKGAFTEARDKVGRLKLAHGGTLFLDEVAETPLAVQAKLLRVLETGTFEPLGETQSVHVDIRLVSATLKDLEEEVRKGRFREDLYWRLRGVVIRIPPLRERAEDIPLLIGAFLDKTKSDVRFEPDAIRVLMRYAFPGNVRQLLRLVEEMDAVSETRRIRAADLPEYIRRSGGSGGETPDHSPRSGGAESRNAQSGADAGYSEIQGTGGILRTERMETGAQTSGEFPPLDEIITEVEKTWMQKALETTGGNCERAIQLLKISRARFFERKKKFGL